MSAFIPFPHKRLENDPAGVKAAYLEGRRGGGMPVLLLVEPEMAPFGEEEEWDMLSLLAEDAMEESCALDLQEALEEKAEELDLYPECFSMEKDEGIRENDLYLGLDDTLELYLAEFPGEPWEVLAFLPGGLWGEPVPPEFLALARKWQVKHGAVPAAIGFNTLQFYVEEPVTDPEELETLCHEMLLFCPELIEMHALSFGNLTEQVSKSHFWYFVWD